MLLLLLLLMVFPGYGGGVVNDVVEEKDEEEEATWESMLVMGPVRLLATRVMVWLSWLAEATVKGLKRRSKMNDRDIACWLVLPSGGRLR